ncbi:nonstructural protein 2 [Dendrolimus punctatus densovirus]|uniref:Nonstructural protein 2 n=1 Tax=Dendrolimus punctatus densovirus TaxID=292208 RepID=Q66NY4_9VIRU|nr:nonstructural protein 2 [Dendrolimus punctatus densovirus]AAU12254.1 nonstructural protein 2 [Dendrolimus punctatus densovirus]
MFQLIANKGLLTGIMKSLVSMKIVPSLQTKSLITTAWTETQEKIQYLEEKIKSVQEDSSPLQNILYEIPQLSELLEEGFSDQIADYHFQLIIVELSKWLITQWSLEPETMETDPQLECLQSLWNSAMEMSMVTPIILKESSANFINVLKEEWNDSELTYMKLLETIAEGPDAYFTIALNTKNQDMDALIQWWKNSSNALTKEMDALFSSMNRLTKKANGHTQKTSQEDTTQISTSVSSKTTKCGTESLPKNPRKRIAVTEESSEDEDGSTSKNTPTFMTPKSKKSTKLEKAGRSKGQTLLPFQYQSKGTSTSYMPVLGTTKNVGASQGILTSIRERTMLCEANALAQNILETSCSITQNGRDGQFTLKCPTKKNSDLFIELNLYEKKNYDPSNKMNWKGALVRLKFDVKETEREAQMVNMIVDAQTTRIQDHPKRETVYKRSSDLYNKNQHGH